MNKIEKSIKENLEFRDHLKNSSLGIDHDLLKKYIPFFQLIDESKTSIVVVQDLLNNKIYYVSEQFYEVFGFPQKRIEGIDHVWFRKQFHPDDYIINVTGIALYKYLLTLPLKLRKDYKLIHEFRIKNEFNKWIRLLIQDFILELDDEGNPWLNMKLCDLSPNQDINKLGTSICRNIITGENVAILEDNKNEKIEGISDREKEVLLLISEGMRSKEIADRLCISANTVNNHRRNVLRKLNVSNSFEAINQAAKFGLI